MVTASHQGVFSLFGKTRRSVLALLFTHVDRSFYLREIVRLTGEGVGPVQREMKTLAEAGIVTRRKDGHQVYYEANRRSPIFPELKSLIIKTFGVGDMLREALAPLADKIQFAFIYGSFARGEEKSTSDVDVMVVGEVSLKELVSAFRHAQRLLAREINPSVYSPREFRDKLRAGHHFVTRVVGDPIIMLYGGQNDIRGLGRERLD
jgi:predicted nucleotidyltransferase